MSSKCNNGILLCTLKTAGFFSVNKHFVSRQAPTAGGICNSVNVSGSQGRPVTGLSVLEADNPATKSLIIHKNELENAI